MRDADPRSGEIAAGERLQEVVTLPVVDPLDAEDVCLLLSLDSLYDRSRAGKRRHLGRGLDEDLLERVTREAPSGSRAAGSGRGLGSMTPLHRRHPER